MQLLQGHAALWFLRAPSHLLHLTLLVHITPATPPMALTTAAPKAMPHAVTPCFGSQKPLTPEHQYPQAAGPVSPSQPRGLGNGPRSPAL